MNGTFGFSPRAEETVSKGKEPLSHYCLSPRHKKLNKKTVYFFCMAGGGCARQPLTITVKKFATRLRWGLLKLLFFGFTNRKTKNLPTLFRLYHNTPRRHWIQRTSKRVVVNAMQTSERQGGRSDVMLSHSLLFDRILRLIKKRYKKILIKQTFQKQLYYMDHV